MVTKQEQILLLIPLGGLLLYLLSKDEPAGQPETVAIVAVISENGGKEARFLEYNKDSIYSNLLATEEHFQRMKTSGKDTRLFQQCCVKHLSLVGSHTSEATSHTVSLGDVATSEKYRELNDAVTDLRHDIQAGKVSPSEGIERTRKIKHEFESFNPEFDVSLCKIACDVNG